MKTVERRLHFILGLNLWGFGLLFANRAMTVGDLHSWLVSCILLLSGSAFPALEVVSGKDE
jgi:hypothetical protein